MALVSEHTDVCQKDDEQNLYKLGRRNQKRLRNVF